LRRPAAEVLAQAPHLAEYATGMESPAIDMGDAYDPVWAKCVELGVAPTFILAGGILGEGDRWTCPSEAWDWLPQMRFYLRALDRDSGELLGAWWFDKASPGRYTAMDAKEIAELGERVWGLAV